MDMYSGYITDVKGIEVGHAHSEEGMTGCTVVLCEKGAITGVDVRGSAPGTRETDLLKPDKLVSNVHGIILSGGSAFGLDAASGVMKYLEEKNIGFDVNITKVPIVTGAVLFDLSIGNHKIRPDLNMGYEASNAVSLKKRSQGNVGAGMGATVGKILGSEKVMKSGLGSASVNIGDLWIGAIVVVNAFGDIYDYETNRLLAGAYDRDTCNLVNSYEILKEKGSVDGFPLGNTTIGVIATNGKLTKNEVNKVAQMGHNGYAKSINPIHTMYDGDTIFCMATGEVNVDVNIVGTLGSEVISRAIINAVKSAKGYRDIPSWQDIVKKI